MSVLRIDRMLASQGIASRSKIKELISGGFVSVNGKIVTNPAVKVDIDNDKVIVNGMQVKYRKYIYIMMNKPAGVISASNDPRQKTVIDLLPDGLKRPGLFPAGRLDRDTEGFLLITDDGKFAHDILSPKKHVDKEYTAVIDSPLSPYEIEQFESGLVIDGNFTCLPAKVKMLESGVSSGGAKAIVTIHEGKFHQIKRMFKALGHEVLYLKRNSIGGVCLDLSLKPGESRELTEEEINLLREQVNRHSMG